MDITGFFDGKVGWLKHEYISSLSDPENQRFQFYSFVACRPGLYSSLMGIAFNKCTQKRCCMNLIPENELLVYQRKRLRKA